MSFTIDTDVDMDGIAIVTWAPGGEPDLLRPTVVRALADTVERICSDDAIIGAVLAGGPRCFLGSLDPEWLDSRTRAGDTSKLLEEVLAFSILLRRVEQAEKPFAAALTGDAAGAGLDLALACRYRVIADPSSTQIGFADIRFGLPPAGGGAMRLAKLIGDEKAFGMLSSGKTLFARAARAEGLVDEAVAGDHVLATARDWVIAEAALRSQRPARRAIRTMIDLTLPPGGDSDILAAERFVETAFTPVSRAMVQTLGLSVARANDLERRPAAVPKRRFERVGVLGAGLMGGGIALTAARAGMDVTLLDVDRAAAERGLEKVKRREEALVVSGRADAATVGRTLASIRPTASYDDLSLVDIVVEAVYEDRAVKAEATRRAEKVIRPGAIFATNTSTLPIHGLAEASSRPDSFIGLHFFSPVPRMPLLEIIRGRQTSDETLAASMDFAQAIGKTPILVNDSRGFYTTRVVMAYQAEAYDMLAGGIRPDLIEQAGAASGMPVPPLALSDAVGLDLVNQINRQTEADLGDAYSQTPGYALVARLVEEHDRVGKKRGRGFFDYDEDGKPIGIWSGLSALVANGADRDAPIADLKDRLLAAQALETARCMEEGVITDPSEADLGAILGWGFAPWTGGPLSYIDGVGVKRFVARCDVLAERYDSERLNAPDWLRRCKEACRKKPDNPEVDRPRFPGAMADFG